MVHWYCCSARCTNNHSTILPDGCKVKKYRLPRNEDLQQKYTSILKTSGIYFNTGKICSEHWSKGYRESTADLPDVPVPSFQFIKLQEPIKTPKAKKQIRTLKRKLNAAERTVSSSPSPSSQISRESARKLPHKRVISTPIKKPSMYRRQLYKEKL